MRGGHRSNDVVYWIPPEKTSMTWFTGFHQQPGRLMHGQFHSHQKYFEVAYVFSGSPESLGLNQVRTLQLRESATRTSVVGS